MSCDIRPPVCVSVCGLSETKNDNGLAESGMLFLEVQMKLNFLQFDVLNVKIQAQEG